MAITMVDKVKINKVLKKHALGDIYYDDFINAIESKKKISDSEFLDYFVDLFVNEVSKSEKISANYLAKIASCVAGFLQFTSEKKEEVSEDILNKVRNFQSFYEEYLKRNDLESDPDAVREIEAALESVNEYYALDAAGEDVSKYISKIVELEAQVKRLEKESKEISSLHRTAQNSYEKATEKVSLLRKDITAFKRDIKNREIEVEKLKVEIEGLNGRILELSESFVQAKQENERLRPYQEQCTLLSGEVSNLRALIDADREAKLDAEELKVRNSNLAALIYEKILTERVGVDDLVSYLGTCGFTSSNAEVIDLLTKLKKIVNIDSSTFSTHPTYKVKPPALTKNGKFSINIPSGCKYYDIMLASDFHIREFNTSVLSRFDALNDYCVKNGIHLVLNLGDFFNGVSGRTLSLDSAITNYQIVNESISKIPKADGVYQAILGGNHEKGIVNHGFDPIAFLAQERGDFINLGYTHSTISLDGPTQTLGQFDIHHPDIYTFPIALNEDGMDISKIDTYLQELYCARGRNRDDSYIDIIGHTHRRHFNFPGSFYFLPAYYGDDFGGVCHLRVYFNEDTDIKYMAFMPLDAGKTLVKKDEIVYQKVKRQDFSSNNTK